MSCWNSKKDTMGDDPPYLAVGTEVSAKYKGAFCEAKIRKVVRSVKCKIIYKQGLGGATVTDDQIRGTLRAGSVCEVKHPEKKEFVEANITKIQDCSQYTVVFDDGDITTLRRSALCLKSGRHFAESETLDQLPLTHPEHFSNPVIGGRRGRRNRNGVEESSDEDEPSRRGRGSRDEKEADIGRVVCVEGGDKKKQKDNWFPGLVVAPTAQDTVRIHVKDEYLVRSFKDGRYYTVPKKEATEFTREIGLKVDNHTLRGAVEKALMFLDRDELPPHWDRELLFGLVETTATDSEPGFDSDSSDDEPREEKDHFVAQLYKFMDDRGTPINKGPTISTRDVDLYRLFKVVHNLGGYNRVTNHNHWKTVSHKIGFGQNPVTVNLVKHAYKKFLHSFEEFYRKLGCTMVNHPRINRNRNKTGRSLIRDRDKTLPVNTVKSEPKEKPVEKEDDVSTPSHLPNEQPITDIKIKVEIDDASTSRDGTKDSRLKAVDNKDKGVGKKVVEQVPTLIKIKEEKQDDTEKVIVEAAKEMPKKAKTRKTQSKFNQTETKKGDNPKENVPKEKKKRLFSRMTGKKDKVAKISKPSGLTTTRQKRTMKDRMKAIVDKLKMKPTKDVSTFGVQENSEKAVQGAKMKIKEEPGTIQVKSKKDETIATGPGNEEKKKVGRKRKDRQDTTEDVLDILPTYKTICIGDKLKVYYGPTHESKVTYEAKVLNIRGEGCDVMYFVHYTGWNTRYDEWIKYSRIADNLSWTPGRLPKKTNQSPKCGKRKCSSGKGESGGRSTPSSITSTSSKTKSKTPKSKLSISESEVEYDSENTDVEHSINIKVRPEKFQEETVREEEALEESPIESQHEKKRGKRKLDEDDNVRVEKKKSEDKIKVEVIENNEIVVDNNIRNEKRRTNEKKIENDDITICEKKNLTEKRKIDEIIEQKDVQSDEVKISFVSLKEEEIEIDESDYDDNRKGKEKIDEQTIEICDDDSSHKSKNWDKVADSDHDLKSELLVLDSELEIGDKKGKPKGIDKEICKKMKIELSEDNQGIGRDFDLNQIRSELKGIDKTIKVAIGVLEEQKDGEDVDDTIKHEVDDSEQFEAEDIYEFKEPEPFYFEARKVNDDKSKQTRRSLVRLLEESKLSPSKRKSKSSSPVTFETKKKLCNESEKDIIESNANIQHIEACEETFDKICASPLRAATEEPTSEMKLFNELPAEDDDELDEDSEDRLVISEHESDSEALFTHQYRNHEEIFPTEIRSTPPPGSDESVRFSDYSCKISDEISIENKDNFPKDDEDEDEDEDDEDDEDIDVDVDVDVDDEEDMENEAISSAINRVISQDTTDESNEEDMSAPSSPKIENIEIESEIKNKIPDMNMLVETDVSRIEPTISEVNDVENKPETETDHLVASSMDISEHSSDEFEELKETMITTPLETKGLSLLEEAEKRCATEFEIAEAMIGGGDSNLIEETDTIEISKEDTSEGNLVALLCKETIPGSPTPQMEPVIETVEEKTAELVVSEPSYNKETSSYDKQPQDESVPLVQVQESPAKEAAPVMDNTPPTTPESPMSSISVSPRDERSASSPPLDNESTKSHRESEVEMEPFPEQKEITDDESRIEESTVKVENIRIPGKKGRRTRKRSEDASKRKFPRRHHGSDSDDTSENSVSNRLDISSSRPSRPCKYNYNVQLGPELDANQRITILTQALQDLRKTYANVKAELASIDRRRKKLRKREREHALSRLH